MVDCVAIHGNGSNPCFFSHRSKDGASWMFLKYAVARVTCEKSKPDEAKISRTTFMLNPIWPCKSPVCKLRPSGPMLAVPEIRSRRQEDVSTDTARLKALPYLCPCRLQSTSQAIRSCKFLVVRPALSPGAQHSIQRFRVGQQWHSSLVAPWQGGEPFLPVSHQEGVEGSSETP